MLKQFKEFAFKGNLIDMAVGIIIGGAFATVVKSLVSNVLMPPLGVLTASVDFKNLRIPIVDGDPSTGKEAVTIDYGVFLTDLISFLLMAFAVFLVVKKIIGAMEKEKESASAEPARQEVLLEEIRDLLKKD
ncbi:MAG: large-conductance mechanosensitive channel protein MscL [Akkermansiaceae bacterium]